MGAILVAAGFGLAQLVNRDTIETAAGVVAEKGPDSESSAGPADEATAEGSEPSLPSPLDQLPLDRDELERLLDEFRDRLGEDFAVPFDELPLPENLPELDQLPELERLPNVLELLALLEQLPLDRAEVEGLFDEFQQGLPENFDFEGELRVPDDLPFLDELPLEGSELDEWLERLRDRLGERFSPGSELPSPDGSSDGSDLEA